MFAGAGKMFNDIVLKFGFPMCIDHGQGREFNNNLFRMLHKLSGITASKMHPDGGWTNRKDESDDNKHAKDIEKRKGLAEAFNEVNLCV